MYLQVTAIAAVLRSLVVCKVFPSLQIQTSACKYKYWSISTCRRWVRVLVQVNKRTMDLYFQVTCGITYSAHYNNGTSITLILVMLPTSVLVELIEIEP